MRFIGMILMLPMLAAADDLKRLPVARVGVDVVLTGLAGISLGQTFEVEATAVPEPERDAPKELRYNYLRVTSVNGHKLKPAEEIPLWGDFKVPQGITFRLTVRGRSLRTIHDAQS
jgi:hypothetical protein